MKITFIPGLLRHFIFAIGVLLLTAGAHADISVSTSNNALVAMRGDVVTIQGTIQNTGATTVYVNGDSVAASLNSTAISPPVYELFFDDSPFANGAPITLAPGEQWSGSLCQITIGIDSPTQTYALAFSVMGGSDATQFNILGTGSFQVMVTNSAPTAPPGAPSALTATLPATNQVSLTWSDAAGDEDSISIERSTDGGANWTQVGTTLSDAAPYTDSTIQGGISYLYRVRAYNAYLGGSYSPASNLVTVITPPSQVPGSGDGLLGSYYNDHGNHYAGTPALVRIDPTVDFVFTGVPPGPGVGGTNATNFSVVWKGEVLAQYTETYTFYTDTDDSAALFVNGQQLVNDPNSHTLAESSGTIQLTAGQLYTIEMDYFQGSSAAEAHLSWSSPSTPQQIIPQACLFSGIAGSAPSGLTATAASGSEVDLSWNGSSSNAANFLVQRKVGASGTYATVAIVPCNAVAFSDVSLASATNYFYRVQAVNFGSSSDYSNEANAVTPGPPLAPDLLTAASPAYNQVNLNWTDSSGGAAGFFVERSADNGGTWTQINDSPVFATTFTDRTTLASSTYMYRVRAVNNDQGGSYSVYSNTYTIVTSSMQFNPSGDGLLGAYYNDSDPTVHLTGTPILVRVDPTINLSGYGVAPGPGVSGTFFSVKWTGMVQAQYTETYTFYTELDDGAMLYVNGALVSSNWTFHNAATENSGTISLIAGQLYTIEMDFFQVDGPYEAQLLWSSPSTTKQLVPQSQLFSGTGVGVPTNFAASAVSTSQINLSWNGSSPPGFIIQRQDGPGAAFLQVATAAAASTALQDTGLSSGTQYSYRILSYNSGADSAFASVTTATPTLAPAGLAASGADGSINLTWTAPTYDGDLSDLTYNVYRGTSPGSETLIASSVATTAFVDTGLRYGQTYYYKVSATDPGGESDFSSEVSASPTTPSSFQVTYASASDVPIAASSFTATNRTVNLALNFAPAAGTNLTVVKNFGLDFIHGNFSNLAQGQVVVLPYNGVNYTFVANYYGGTERDLVLQWGNVRVLSWGDNFGSELGRPFSSNDAIPGPVNPLGVLAGKVVTAVAPGYVHSVALCSDGSLAAWGNDGDGQLGSQSFADTTVPVAVDQSGVLAGKTVVAIACGEYHSLALCSDGTVAAWGWNLDGQLGSSAGLYSTAPVAVDTSGVLAGKTVVAISAGESFSLALCSDGTVAGWGDNSSGQLGNNSNTGSTVPVAVDTSGVLTGKTVVSIAAGGLHSVALCADGTVAAWGDGTYGQLGNNSNAPSPVPVAVDTSALSAIQGKTVTTIGAGYLHSMAFCSDGTVVTWGYNVLGQLGTGTGTDSSVPVAVDTSGVLAGKTVVAIIAGSYHNFVLCADGTLAGWGNDYDGELGDNNTFTDSPVPVLVNTSMLAPAERWQAVTASSRSNSTLALVAAPPAPTATTLPATSITASSVTLNGAVNANNNDGTVSFDFGTDTTYGTNVPGTPLAVTGGSPTAVSVAFSDLNPGTTYHFRVNGTNSVGTANGLDATFTTLSTNSALSGLVLSTGTLSPAFDGGTTTYTANVPDTTATVSVTPTVADNTATVQVNSAPVNSGAASDSINLNTGNNTINVLVTAQDGSTTNYSVVVTQLTNLQVWRQTYFNTIANSGNAADDFDNTGDGVSNLMKYAFGLDPTSAASMQLPQPVLAGNVLTISFTEPANVSGITYSAEWTETLNPPNWAAVPDFGFGTNHVFSISVTGHPSLFMRLKVCDP